MIVTAVERTRGRRGRVDVYVDGVLALEVARDTAAKRELRPGRPIERAEIEAIAAADARRRAMESAVAMLARRPRSEREIRLRLARQKCAPALVDETVARLRELRLIDDAGFARTWAESRDRSSPRGTRLLVQELRALGVEAAIAREAVGEISDADAAYRVALRRLPALKSLDLATFRARLGGHLQRRGFGWDVVAATVARCWRELGGDTSEDDLARAVE